MTKSLKKIGQVIEDHLITEDMIRYKLNQSQSKETIQEFIILQIEKLKEKDATIQNIAHFLDIDIDYLINHHLNHTFKNQLDKFYLSYKSKPVTHVLPQQLIQIADNNIDKVTEFLCERARIYLNSAKAAHDIYEMLDTFFQEKGKIIGLLQMFMTKESIAERIQYELIRLTEHPKARSIINKVIHNEYETLKHKQLGELIGDDQFEKISQSTSELVLSYLNLNDKARMPVNDLAPKIIQYFEIEAAPIITRSIVDNISHHLPVIMQKINLRQLIEDQINTFELDYIERLIIEIANKELKSIMSLGFILGGIIGFILGGIIGFFQGIIAIFV